MIVSERVRWLGLEWAEDHPLQHLGCCSVTPLSVHPVQPALPTPLVISQSSEPMYSFPSCGCGVSCEYSGADPVIKVVGLVHSHLFIPKPVCKATLEGIISSERQVCRGGPS